jgi:hypothetical protein
MRQKAAAPWMAVMTKAKLTCFMMLLVEELK